MGYLSDVGLCLTENGKKTLDDKLAELEAGTDRTQNIHEFLNSSRNELEDTESGAVAWFWEYIKWYPDYDNVVFIENLLQNMDEEDYYFIRVGQCDDDTEIDGRFCRNPFCMGLIRGITFG